MPDIKKIGDVLGLPNHMKIVHGEEAYTVLVNPASYSVKYAAEYINDQAIGTCTSNFRFNKAQSQTMNLDLLFDSTGSLGKLAAVSTKNVLEQIEQFLAITYVQEKNETKGKPLQLIWGPMTFSGILESVDITYSHFDATGNPIRAKATCAFSGGNVDFDQADQKNLFEKKDLPRKLLDLAKHKHPLNALEEHGNYMNIVAKQGPKTMPKSLRKADEIAKMIIK
jgi:hypothetical protein